MYCSNLFIPTYNNIMHLLFIFKSFFHSLDLTQILGNSHRVIVLKLENCFVTYVAGAAEVFF